MPAVELAAWAAQAPQAAPQAAVAAVATMAVKGEVEEGEDLLGAGATAMVVER